MRHAWLDYTYDAFTLSHYRPMNLICVDAIGSFNIEGQKSHRIFVIIIVVDTFSLLEIEIETRNVEVKQFPSESLLLLILF